MSTLTDPASGLVIGDTTQLPELLRSPVLFDDIARSSQNIILSASGWRKVFSASGDEEDRSPIVKPQDIVIAGLMARTFADWLAGHKRTQHNKLTIALGIDTRPTGKILADAAIRAVLSTGMRVSYLFIAPAPETMAYTRIEDGIDGFCYISASHNPIGHNGFKFGLDNGGVLGGDESKTLIETFRGVITDPSAPEKLVHAMLQIPESKLVSVFKDVTANKERSLACYSAFTKAVSTDKTDPAAIDSVIKLLKSSFKTAEAGVVAELNGSARCLSIDHDLLESFGINTLIINGEPGKIVHRIIPEGPSLDGCKKALEQIVAKQPGTNIGYVPDCDGDRGNVVYANREGRVSILDAQNVFALVVLSELCWMVREGTLKYDQNGRSLQKVAVVVNDATSLRIEEIASRFDVDVFRSEVGEANVVALAAQLRKRGFIVRILGEGSNGGTIIFPSAVRDPLQTILSILRLCHVKDYEGKPALWRIWCERNNKPYNVDADLEEILSELPKWTTTPNSEERAIVKLKTDDHALFKARYEELFKKTFEDHKIELAKRLDAQFWEEINYEGTTEFRGVGKNFRTGKERGGFKILFKDGSGRPVGFIWMRGSGTEPVFRVMADVKGKNPELETWLLAWHVSLVKKADSF